MIHSKKVLAVILARGGSKGIKKKNIIPLDGHPLISYSIAAAKNSKYIDEIIISTDSIEIQKISKKYGGLISFTRPASLSGDKVLSVNALKHAVLTHEKIVEKKFDYIIELPCVAPFRDHKHIDTALKLLFDKKADSVISYVNTGEKHPTRLKRIKKNKVSDFCREYPEPKSGSRRQDFENSYIRNGAIYSMTRETLLKKNSRHGKFSYPFIMPEKVSINIDNKFDLKIADLLMKNGECLNFPKIAYDLKINLRNNKQKLLALNSFDFMGEVKKKFQEKFGCSFFYNIDKRDLEKIIGRYDIIICHPSPDYKYDAKLLSKAVNLKVICTPSTGTNHIDLAFCKRNRIKIIGIRDHKELKYIKASSEFTFLLLLAALKKIHLAFQKSKNDHWRKNEPFLRGNELRKKTIGIIGLGRIGSNLVKYLKPFECKILGFDIKNIRISNVKIEKNINSLLKVSDIICVCIHLNKKNFKFINKEKFKMMKKGVIFINTSRGEIVDESALLKNLISKKISCAALDVLSKENLIGKIKNPLIEYSRKNDNLLISPHIAGLTVESETLASKIILKELLKDY